ncbi:MAG: hypothetical protein JRH20_21160 [Deltaproteobacteria bacterium]|nr:hypothetical protein [Deltaproteobacteria bacterium]
MTTREKTTVTNAPLALRTAGLLGKTPRDAIAPKLKKSPTKQWFPNYFGPVQAPSKQGVTPAPKVHKKRPRPLKRPSKPQEH